MKIIDFTGIFDLDGKFWPFNGHGELIDLLVGFSEKATREGWPSLEDELTGIDNSILSNLLQLITDGTDPETVKTIGEESLKSTIHSLEEILYCIKILIENDDKKESVNLFNSYVKSRNIEQYSNIVNDIFDAIGKIKNDKALNVIGSQRYRDLVDLIRNNFNNDIKQEILSNHFDSILHQNRVYNKIILIGLLGIQAGDNLILLGKKLYAMAGLSYSNFEKTKSVETCAEFDTIEFKGIVEACEILVAIDNKTGRYVLPNAVKEKIGCEISGDTIKAGRGTKIIGDYIVARIKGDISIEKNVINVNQINVVKSDVDYDTGDIIYFGSVVVYGNITKNYSVKATGNIYIYGFIEEGATVEASGEIILMGQNASLSY